MWSDLRFRFGVGMLVLIAGLLIIMFGVYAECEWFNDDSKRLVVGQDVYLTDDNHDGEGLFIILPGLFVFSVPVLVAAHWVDEHWKEFSGKKIGGE